MKLRNLSLSLILALAGSSAALAQVPAGAPAGTTGVCKDGTFSNAASKAGACSGHKGVKTWVGATPAKSSTTATAATPAAPAAAAAPAAPAAPAAAATPATPASKTATVVPTPANKTVAVAPGGAADKVWVNTESKVYHCFGAKYYGTTKKGSYMSETEAIAAGNHADHKKACAK